MHCVEDAFLLTDANEEAPRQDLLQRHRENEPLWTVPCSGPGTGPGAGPGAAPDAGLAVGVR